MTMTDDLTAVFAEAAAKRTEADGRALRIGEHRFPLWPSRFTYAQRMQVAQLTNMTPSELMFAFSGGSASIESFAAFIAMSTFQQGARPSSIKMDQVVAFVEQQLFDVGAELEVESLRVDDGSPPDEGVVLVAESSEGAGPE